MKTLILSTVSALALMAGGSEAKAGGRIFVGVGGGYPGYGYTNNGFGYGGYGGYGGFGNYGGGYGINGHVHHFANPYVNPGRGHYDWHDTTHYDYVPGGLYRHGNHMHYRPGRYILHQDGHWDLHH